MADQEKSAAPFSGRVSDLPSTAAVATPQLSVPKGGGAIRGIGEKFACNAVTGTGSLNVPISTSAGRSGFGPQLALTYNTGAGNGPFGFGWTIGAPAITRKTDKGLPRYHDTAESDVFILSGMEDLVPEMRPDGSRHVDDQSAPGFLIYRYRPRIEGLFARIERWTNLESGETHWRSISRDNVTTLYGVDEDAQIFDLFDPSPRRPKRIFSWLISSSYDDKGNAIVYEYARENDVGVNVASGSERDRYRTANRYLKRIYYGNRTALYPAQGALGPKASDRSWLFEVVFDYDDGHYADESPTADGKQRVRAQCEPCGVAGWPVRADPFSTFRSGFEVRTYRLCRRILMFHRFPEDLGEEAYLVRSTEFSYLPSPVASYLTGVTYAGYLRAAPDEPHLYVKQALPPVEFEFSRTPTAQEIARQPVQCLDPVSLENLPIGVDGATYEWLDLDGEGSAGILSEQAEAWFFKRNLSANNPPDHSQTFGAGETRPRFGAAELVAEKPAGLLAHGARFVDLRGDARQSLIETRGDLRGFYGRSDERAWLPFRAFVSWPDVDTGNPNVRFIDLTGNGRADIMVTEGQVFTWYPSLAEEGFGPGERVCPVWDESRTLRLVFADDTESIYLADMSGDGLSDILRIRNGEVCYWPNLGYGRFGNKIAMQGSPRFDLPDQFDQKGILLADVDGSGMTDILYRGRDGLTLYLNRSGNGWSEAIPIPQFPASDPLCTVNAVDLLGSGTVCVVWSSPNPGFGSSPMRYVSLMDHKPHLLVRSTNNLGAETRVHYAPSTKFYLQAEQCGRPWVTRLPFPVQVVEKLTTVDFISRTRFTSHFAYHHGYYDAREREFRGFGMVEQTDTEAFEEYAAGIDEIDGVQTKEREAYQPPVTSRSWFHLGSFELNEKLAQRYRREYFLHRQLLPPPRLPDGIDVRDVPECLRALKGQLLRQETYSRDGSDKARFPYQTTEITYEVRLLQPRASRQHAVAFPAPRESVSCQYERNPADPRVSQSLNLEIDDFGNVRKSCSITHGRRKPDPSLPPEVRCEQEKFYVTYTVKDFTPNFDCSDPPAYRVGVPYGFRSYEITGLHAKGELFSYADVRDQIAEAVEIPYSALAAPDRIEKRLLSRSLTLFLSNKLAPLAPGKWDTLALRYRSYQLAFAAGAIREYFGERVTPADLEAGFYVQVGGAEDWWIPSATAIYGDDPAADFYIPRGARDATGLETFVTLDRYRLLSIRTEVRQAAWNTTSAVNDYRVLGPILVTDANRNRTAVAIDALGMVERFAVMGKEGSSEGDTLEDPTTRVEYELWEWMRHRRPNFAHSFAREAHGPANPGWQESYAYSNGGGAVVMTKAQAAPGKALRMDAQGRLIEVDANPRWVGNGRVVFNNKGNPIKQYEPYFSATQAFESEREIGPVGVTPIFHYDALGRNTRTDFPNGTFTRIEFDPWRSLAFDANDTVTESAWYRALGSPSPHESEPSEPDRRAAWLAAHHADTPSVAHFDSLGRAVASVVDYGHGKTSMTRSENDLTGRYSRSFDQLGREAASGFTGLAGIPIVSTSAEKGRRWVFHTALGELYKSWDEFGREFRTEYDVLRRPVNVYVREAGKPEIAFNFVVYGDRLADAAERNLLGAAYLTFDQGGLLRVPRLDFKSMPICIETAIAREYRSSLDWSALGGIADVAALEAAANEALEAEVFSVRSEYDALDRPTRVTVPDGSVFLPRYDAANNLASLKVQIRGRGAFIEFLKDQDFDAKGQRRFVRLGNDVLTRYFYDPKTFRLERLLTTSPVRDRDRHDVQDLRYTYDPVGNVVQMRDDAQQTRFFAQSVVRPGSLYRYNAIYQLTRATGREHASRTLGVERSEREVEHAPRLPHANDEHALRVYREDYEYDVLGNMLELRHRFRPSNGQPGGWTQRFRYAYQEDAADRTNRLVASSVAGDKPEGPYHATYAYDHQGNMLRMAHLETMAWDFLDRMVQVGLGGGGTAYYRYDNYGQHLRKVVERPGGMRVERIYLGAVEILRKRRGDGAPYFESYTLHVADAGERLAQIDTKTIDENDSEPENPIDAPLIRYQHANHVGSTTLETDVGGHVISYEEFHPYGTSAYRSFKSRVEFSLKRYRYCGQEHDDDTGLYYFGARYYAPWLARWVSADPGGYLDGLNLFQYCHCNPIGVHDLTGLEGVRVYQLGAQYDQDLHTNTPEAKARIEGALSGRQVEENGVIYQINRATVEWRGDKIGWFFTPGKSDISIVDAETITFDPDVIEGKPSTAPPTDDSDKGGVDEGSPQGSTEGTDAGGSDNAGAGGQGEKGQGSGGGGKGEGSGGDDDSFFTSSFFKGIAVGLAVTVLAVAVVATGGAALAVIAPAAAEVIAASGIGTALAVAGGAVTVANTVQSVRRRDLWNNPISRDEANFNLGFGVGAALGGAAAKPFAGAGTALGKGLGQGMVKTAQGMAEGMADLGADGMLVATAGGPELGGAIAAPATATGTAVSSTTAGAGIGMGAGVLYRSGHSADWELRDSNGRIKTRGHAESGGTKPGRRLSWPEQAETHTERKILAKLIGKTTPGEHITIRGTKDPCSPGGRGCASAMREFAAKYGVKITYTNTTTGQSWVY